MHQLPPHLPPAHFRIFHSIHLANVFTQMSVTSFTADEYPGMGKGQRGLLEVATAVARKRERLRHRDP